MNKKEGDGVTPAGTWPLKHILYRSDKVSRPDTRLPVDELKPADGWCDSPADPNYNRPVQHPYPASAEHLWREDDLYDVIIILGHNDDPVIPGAGSAIFFHIAKPDYGPTHGCVAISHAHMTDVLRLCGPDTVMEIRV